MTSFDIDGDGPDLNALLLWQFDMTWGLGRDHVLPRLGDAACHHLPAGASWTVRRDAAGDWHGDWHMPEPEDLPPPSLAWQTWHLVMWWTQALAVVGGEPAPSPPDILWPGSTAATVSRIHDLAHVWRELLTSWTADDLHRPTSYPWTTPRSLGYTVAWLNSELMKNLGEIGMTAGLFDAGERRL
jgi:hypothetical protein